MGAIDIHEKDKLNKTEFKKLIQQAVKVNSVQEMKFSNF